ncbi:hypothetical protein VF02_20340, partial [Nostoc linckia z1]
KHVMVKGIKSPYDGDTVYWSERNSKLYDGETSKALKKQNHKCASCGLKFIDEERVNLHHIDKNHANWKKSNLTEILSTGANVTVNSMTVKPLKPLKSKTINVLPAV